MNAIAGSSLRILSPDTVLRQKLKSELEWMNPEYIKRTEAGRSTWNCERMIRLWKDVGNDIVVPFGLLPELWARGIAVSPTDHIKSPVRAFNESVDGLYTYQEQALRSALKSKQGVLVAPCGSGKTQIGIAICAAYGYRTLWLTHTHELLKQSMERAKRYLKMPMGTITGGKIDASEGITFATVQTMAKIDLSDFREFWDLIIVDECHRCVGTPTRMTMFWKVVNSLSARHKFGLTATPKRSDGMEKAMFALLGPKFHEITKQEVAQSTVPLKVNQPIRTGWVPNYDEILNPDGTLNYTSLITDCINDKHRNAIIASAINEASKDGPTLVLSERVAHLKTLSEMCECTTGNLSGAKKSERNGLISRVISGDVRVMFATYAIAKEGLDIPNLKHLVMASPIKEDIAVTQSAGRVMRAYNGKEFGTIWDFEDDMPMLRKWLRKRLSIYEKVTK